jgi:hypothetical protein
MKQVRFHRWRITVALLLAVPLSLLACERLLHSRAQAQQAATRYCTAHQSVDWLRRGTGGYF